MRWTTSWELQLVNYGVDGCKELSPFIKGWIFFSFLHQKFQFMSDLMLFGNARGRYDVKVPYLQFILIQRF